MISEKIIQKANELILADARRNVFPRQLIVDTVLSDKDVVWLLNSAGMLAFGNEVERKLAYEIATRAINFIATPAAALLAKSVLVRLGIFPGAELIAERSLDEIQSPTLALTEEAANRAEAYISVAGQDYYLSPFQRAAFHTMQSHRFSSISAPTSAGEITRYSTPYSQSISGSRQRYNRIHRSDPCAYTRNGDPSPATPPCVGPQLYNRHNA